MLPFVDAFYLKYQKCIDVGMANQVKSPKSIHTRSQQSIADTTVAILGDSAIPTSLLCP